MTGRGRLDLFVGMATALVLVGTLVQPAVADDSVDPAGAPTVEELVELPPAQSAESAEDAVAAVAAEPTLQAGDFEPDVPPTDTDAEDEATDEPNGAEDPFPEDGAGDPSDGRFQGEPQKIFPFEVTGCSSFSDGARCQLAPQVGPMNVGTMKVSTSASAVRFTVVSNGYFDPKGSTITFRTVQRGGMLYLQQRARTISTQPWTGVGVAVGGAALTWHTQANNFRRVLGQAGRRNWIV